MDIEQEVIKTLHAVLGLDGTKRRLDGSSPLLGSVAELDSMAVVAILTALEERFGIVVDDDEIDGHTFSTVGSLKEFVRGKLSS